MAALKNPRGRGRLLVLATAAMLAGGAFLLLRPDPVVRIDAGDAELVELGRGLYRAECASCHGLELEGQPNWRVRNASGRLPAPPHDETGHSWHHADAVLFQVTKYGPSAISPGYESDMPAYADRLSDREIRAVLAYIKSRWPEPILRRQEALNR